MMRHCQTCPAVPRGWLIPEVGVAAGERGRIPQDRTSHHTDDGTKKKKKKLDLGFLSRLPFSPPHALTRSTSLLNLPPRHSHPKTKRKTSRIHLKKNNPTVPLPPRDHLRLLLPRPRATRQPPALSRTGPRVHGRLLRHDALRPRQRVEAGQGAGGRAGGGPDPGQPDQDVQGELKKFFSFFFLST